MISDIMFKKKKVGCMENQEILVSVKRFIEYGLSSKSQTCRVEWFWDVYSRGRKVTKRLVFRRYFKHAHAIWTY